VPSTKPQAPIGILRATLDLKYISGVVSGDTGSNGNGSYAYITDNNGIRIIDSNTNQRFTSVARLNTSQQQAISSEQQFGTAQSVPVIADSTIAHTLQSGKSSSSFQEQPAQQTDQFQVVQQSLNKSIVPWTYFVMSPVPSETAIAQQEQLNIILVGIMTTLTVIVIGLLVGQGISRPILRAVSNLQRNSEKLNALATRQQDAASSQMWVVESSQEGMKSVRYYSQATNFSSHTILQMFNSLVQSWPQLNPDERSRRLSQIMECVQYVKKASSHLGTSNQQLGTALTLAVEVAEQLNEGSRSAGDSAEQLDKIVTDLRAIIGR
jgi:C4-dicarboxylate-specific signal transduction histidine kinase